VVRLLKRKVLLARHCVVSLIENLTTGSSLTVIFKLAESFVPLEAVPTSFTVNVPVDA